MSPYAESEGNTHPSSTPQSTHLATFSPASPSIETPSQGFEIAQQEVYEYGSEHEDVEELLDDPDPLSKTDGEQEEEEQQQVPEPSHVQNPSEIYDLRSLTSMDIQQDPILSKLAQKQTSFKAKPAPKSTNKAALTPRMTKSAALRAGLNWDEIKPQRAVIEGDERGEKSSTPGYKRVGLGISIPSLAKPSITPRPTKSSQLRSKLDKSNNETSSPSVNPQQKVKPTSNDHHKRSSSVPAISRSTQPTILPRQNRTSALRAAGEKGNGGYRDYEKLQQEKAILNFKQQIAIENKEKAKKEREERRKTISSTLNLACHDKPQVEVKQNKTSTMRATGEKGNEGYRNLETIQKEKEGQREKEQLAIQNKERAKIERMERRKTISSTLNLLCHDKPQLEVKQNKTSALRAAGGKGNMGYRDYESIQEAKQAQLIMERLAKENKERGKKEREERRKTLGVVPKSLSGPIITPRANKTSMLRTNSQKSITTLGSLKSPTTPTRDRSRSNTSYSLSRTMSALKVSSADNISNPGVSKPDEGNKIVLTGVRSLGTPSITPRLNRTAMLRAPNSTRTENKPYSRPTLPTSSSTPTIARKAVSTSAPSLESNITASSIPQTPRSPGIAPRPTKASLLRANLGNKVTSS